MGTEEQAHEFNVAVLVQSQADEEDVCAEGLPWVGLGISRAETPESSWEVCSLSCATLSHPVFSARVGACTTASSG